VWAGRFCGGRFRLVGREGIGAIQRQCVAIQRRVFCASPPRATSGPDPYYGGAEDFEVALDLIEDGVEGMLKEMGEE